MAALPHDALVITAGDQDIYPLWYRQMVLGERLDVTVYGSAFVFSGWYAKYFEAEGRPRIPTLAEYRPLPAGPVEGPAIANGALLAGVIVPNLAQGRRVFAAYRDGLLEHYFAPTAAAQNLLTERDYMLTLYPYTLPQPMLYELHPSPELAPLTREQVVDKLRWLYTKAAQNPASN